MRIRGLLVVLALIASGLMVTAAPPPEAGAESALAQTPGTGVDYDLSTVPLRNAQYDLDSGAVITAGAKAKLLLGGLDEPAADRFLEVELTPEIGGVEVFSTFLRDGVLIKTPRIEVVEGISQVVTLDLSEMGTTTGQVKLIIKGSGGGTLVHRVTLYDEEPVDPGPTGPPNIVMILVDDLSETELDIGFGRQIPGWASALERELIDAGTTFENYFNTTPLCCPSRASYFTGQYAHNHDVWNNNGASTIGDNGGLLRFFLDGRENNTLGVWMQSAGYRTGLIGKYLNGYPDRQGVAAFGVTESYVPNGWDEWYGTFLHDRAATDGLQWSYDHYRINENGVINTYGPGAYMTDTEADLAVDFIERNAAAGSAPFMLYLSPYAPHGPTQPSPDYEGLHQFNGVEPAPRPSCGEPDLSDKPQWVQEVAGLGSFGNCWGAGWQAKLDMTLSLDDLIRDVVGALEDAGVIDNTYIFFTSDNGLLVGEHQLGGKSAPYEPSIKVPLIVRGPGVAAGATADHLALNIDIAPTFLEIAGGAPTPDSEPVDGESLLGAMHGSVLDFSWRNAVMVELLYPAAGRQPHVVPRYSAVRTRNHAYITYETGETELYDLGADPYQLDSIHASAPPGLIDELQRYESALRNCAGQDCAVASRTPVVPDEVVVDDIRFIAKPGRYIAKVWVTDRLGNQIEGATVTVDWSPVEGEAPTEVGQTALTNSLGRAKFSFGYDQQPPSGTIAELCVTDMTHAEFGYSGGVVCETVAWP